MKTSPSAFFIKKSTAKKDKERCGEPEVLYLREDYKEYHNERERRRLELQKILSKDLSCIDRLKIYFRAWIQGD